METYKLELNLPVIRGALQERIDSYEMNEGDLFEETFQIDWSKHDPDAPRFVKTLFSVGAAAEALTVQPEHIDVMCQIGLLTRINVHGCELITFESIEALVGKLGEEIGVFEEPSSDWVAS